MVEKSSPRLFGRKWIFGVFSVIPLLLPKAVKHLENRIISIERGVTDTMKTRNDKIL